MEQKIKQTIDQLLKHEISKSEAVSKLLSYRDKDLTLFPKKALPPKENKQILFSESKWSDYETLKLELAKDKSFVTQYAGVDLNRYIDDCLAWSVSKNKKSSDVGWILTLRKWMREAKEKQELKMLKSFTEKKVNLGHTNH